MKLLYVCSAGSRRSMALAAYTDHERAAYGLESLAVSSAALHGERLRRDAEKRERRLQECAIGAYRQHVAALQLGEGDVHPRMGVLLLEDGMRTITKQRALVATPELLSAHDLVLSVERDIRDCLIALAPGHGRIHTVKGFLGYPESEQDIPDLKWYLFPSARYQLWRDRELRDELKGYAQRVLSAIATAHSR